MGKVTLTVLASPRWRKLAGDLRAEKGRIVLMVAAILVSLIAVGTVLGAFAILTREIAANYQGTHPAEATLELDGGIDADLLQRVRQRPDVREADAREVVLARVRVDGNWRPILLFVVQDFDRMRLNTFRSESGAWPPPTGTLLVERAALRGVGGKVGDLLWVKTPNGQAQQVQLSGIVHDPGLAPAWQERQVYAYVTPATLARLGEPATLHELRVTFAKTSKNIEEVEASAAGLAAWLNGQGHPVHQIRVPPPGQHPHERQMATLLLLMLAFAVMALVLSAVLVSSSLAAMLARQVREIGVMKAIGAQSGQIAALYRVLVVALGVVAVVLAVPPSVFSAQALSGVVAGLLNFNLIQASLPWWVYATQIAAGVLVPVLVASVPIRRASRRTIREALDDHGVGAGLLSPRLSRLPYGLRNAFRRPGRLALTLGLLAAGGAMFMTALNVSRGWEFNLAKIEQTRFYDLDVRLHAPLPTTLADAVRRVPNVGKVESWGFAPAAFARAGQVDVVRTYPDRGHGSLSVMAPPAGTDLIRYPLRAGRWLRAGDTDAIVLNHAAFAQLPGAAVGGQVRLSIDGRPSVWRLCGVVEEIGSPGIAYVTDQAFARVTGTVGQASMLRVVAANRNDKPRADMVRAVEQTLAQRGAGIDLMIPLAELRTAIGGHVLLLIQSLVVMALVLGLVGLLGLGSTMSISVIERTREIGVMAAIGATPDRIVRMVVSEAVLVAMLSWLLALLLAVPLTAGLDWLIGTMGFLAPLPFVVAIPPVLVWGALLAGVGWVATLVPATRASRITVREALAHL